MKAKRAQTTDSVEDEADAQSGGVTRSHHLLDPWLTSCHPLVRAVSDNLAFAYEHILVPRKQRMREADRESAKAIIQCAVANLALASFEGEEPLQVGIVLRNAKQKRTRYDRPGFNGLQKVLQVISAADAGLTLRLSGSKTKGVASALLANGGLTETLSRVRFRPKDFQQMEGGETIWLSKVLGRDRVTREVKRELVDYADADWPEAERFRAEMAEINAALRDADVHMLPDGGPPVATSQRTLYRRFNVPAPRPEGGSSSSSPYEYGGRLYGGWWETLKKRRRKWIRISGEPTVEVDFASMLLRLAYLEAGHEPPDGDLYASVPGFTGYRDGVKRIALAMLFRPEPMKRLPRDTRNMLSEGTAAGDIRAALLTAHPALTDVFESGVDTGLRLFFWESQILIAALLQLIRQGGPIALPLHDGLICARPDADVVQRAMEDASERIVGFRLPTSLKQKEKTPPP